MLFAVCFVHAQNGNSFWSQVNLSDAAKGKNVFEKTYQPSAYVSFHLDESAMRAALSTAPSEKTISANKSSFIIYVPNSKGKMERFRIVEASVMQERLQAKHPDMRSYAGRGIDEPSSVIRCDMTPEGFHGMIISGTRNTIYINPVDKTTGTYIVFDRDHLSKQQQIFDCKAEAIANAAKQLAAPATTYTNAGDGKLRVYRFAVESGGEFSALLDAGGSTDAQKKALVLSALTTNLTRIDGIMEADFGVRLDYVNNEDTIIFLTGSTDPFTSSANGYTNGAWNTQSQATLTSYIGSANYDIGHLLMGYATGGNADCIGCVCTAASKGSGATGFTTDLTSDPFVVDFWIHEIGHQFGANHTFNYSNEGTGTQMEPGSGITIMGYAGTTSYDDSAHSIGFYHGISIQQVSTYIQSGNGSTCGTAISTGDATPVANAGTDYTIPASTPFALIGTATDADASDVLTYDWEQFDNGTANKTPVATATAGPQFRCYNATVSTQRNFPQLQYILTGANTYKWEVLPSVSRTMNFRLTVRDNHPGGGQNASDNMVVTVSSTSGPFKVTAPNTAVTYAGGSTQTVTWNVASTTAAPVSCANVAILLSTDGGNTYPYTLLASTPNSGTASVTIPNIATTTARIKIASVGNIFFDIDDANFTITASSGCGTPVSLASSSITTTSAAVSWGTVSGANNYDVDYKADASSTWINAATATTALTVNLSSLTSSTLYDWRVRSNCSSGSSTYATSQFTTATSSSCNSTYDGTTHNSFATAVAIPFNTNVNGTISTATDVDYYKFTITTKGTITINLTTLPANYDLYLYNKNQAQVGSSKKTGTTSDAISKTVGKGVFYVKVVGVSGAFDASNCYTLDVVPGTATLDMSSPVADKNSFSIFPNPVRSMLNINTSKFNPEATIKIMDVYGKTMLVKQTSSSNSQINVSNLSSGIYLLMILNKDGSVAYNSKFVKQ
jgi:hypothetical protein